MVESSPLSTQPNRPSILPRGILEYVAVFVRWRKLIVGTTLVIAILTAAYMWFLVPNVYESSATIRSSVVSQVGTSGLSSMLGGKGIGDIGGLLGLGQQRSDLEQYVGILQSETVLGDVVRRFGLQRDYEAKFFEDAVKRLRKDVSVTTSREMQLLTIAVPDTSPARAQQVCLALITLLDSVNRAMSRHNATSAREYLEIRYQQCVRELAGAEDSLRVFQIKYRVYDMKDQATASIKVAAELEGQIALKEVQANILARTLGAEDADARRMANEVDELKHQRQQLDKGLDVKSAFQSIIPFADAPQLGMEYFRRFRDVEIQQRLFALLYPMYEQSKVEEQRDSPSLLILDSPSLPQRKVRPQRSIITLLIGLFGGILCYVLSLLIEANRLHASMYPDRHALLTAAAGAMLPSLRKK